MPNSQRTARRYAAGETLREIAEPLGVWNKTLWLAIRDQVALRRRGPRGRTAVETRVIVELRDDDRLSFREIADAVGMSKTGSASATPRPMRRRQRRERAA